MEDNSRQINGNIGTNGVSVQGGVTSELLTTSPGLALFGGFACILELVVIKAGNAGSQERDGWLTMACVASLVNTSCSMVAVVAGGYVRQQERHCALSSVLKLDARYRVQMPWTIGCIVTELEKD